MYGSDSSRLDNVKPTRNRTPHGSNSGRLDNVKPTYPAGERGRLDIVKSA
jgi:hypothetical protein